MRFLVRAFLFLLVIGTVGLGVAWWLAGREPGPAISIQLPEKYVGQAGSLEFSVEAPGGLLQTVEAVLEQKGQSTPLFSLGAETGEVDPATPDRMRVVRPIGKKAQPALVSGPATITIRAVRPVYYGLRTAESVVLTCWPPAPDERYVSMRSSVSSISTSSVTMRAIVAGA